MEIGGSDLCNFVVANEASTENGWSLLKREERGSGTLWGVRAQRHLSWRFGRSPEPWRAKPLWGPMSWLVLVAVSGILPLSGCSCDPAPYLGVTNDGTPAIGWRTDGDERVRGARLVEENGTTLWEVAADGASPRVIVVGEAVEGFTTVVPLKGDLELSGRVLWVTYDRDGVPLEDQWPFLESSYEPSSQLAEVKDLDCGGGLGGLGRLNLAGGFGVVAAWLAGVSLFVLLAVGIGHLLRRKAQTAPGERHGAAQQDAPVQRRGRGLVMSGLVVAMTVALAAWLPLLAGVLWPGTAVLERCDQRAAERYDTEVIAIRGEQQVRWWSPGWRCPLTNGETVDISAWP